jgi:hypothetical protein
VKRSGHVATILLILGAASSHAQADAAPLWMRLEVPATIASATRAENERFPSVLVLVGVKPASNLGYKLTVRVADDVSPGEILASTSVVGSPSAAESSPEPRTLVVPLSSRAVRLLSGRKILPVNISVHFIGASNERGLTIERAYLRRTR